ncbi:hypothetical protein D3C79_286770 [compost metagenome]
MSQIDELISELFKSWVGPASDNLELAKNQLYKNLSDQLSGYWSGHTAYWIMTYGGFLMDTPRGKEKKLTALGEMFMKEMEKKQ